MAMELKATETNLNSPDQLHSTSGNGRHAGNGKRTPAVMVIGAGIAGIQTALDVANAGFQVYLVERTSSVGGHMSQLDKTFPTLDCSSCILTPKMSDISN